jgi:DNA-binding PadR family transcriptional regulator
MEATNSTQYEQDLLDAWEASYKQGQLTLWIFLALFDSPKSVGDIRDYLETATSGTLSADDKSLYRSLRRYYETEIVDFTLHPNPKRGPATKVYSLTPLGRQLLTRFVARNIALLANNHQLKEILS